MKSTHKKSILRCFYTRTLISNPVLPNNKYFHWTSCALKLKNDTLESFIFAVFFVLFNVGPPKESIFLTTFFGLYYFCSLYWINDIGTIFSKDWLSRPHNGKTEILENWTFDSEQGVTFGDVIDPKKSPKYHHSVPLALDLL